MRALEAELSQYTEEEGFPQNTEDIVRPGGLVRLNEDDETPRFLGPSSGIAMTRLVMFSGLWGRMLLSHFGQ